MRKKLALTQRWQFLRRNEAYRRAYDSFKEYYDGVYAGIPEGGTKQIAFAPNPRSGEAAKARSVSWLDRIEYIESTSREMFQDYGITAPHDYRDLRLAEGIQICGRSDIIAQKGSLTDLVDHRSPDSWSIHGPYLTETSRIGDACVSTVKFIQVVINRDANMSDIVRQVKAIVSGGPRNQWLVQRIKVTGAPKKQNKSNDGLFEQYLKCYDYHTQGLGTREIGKRLFRKLSSDDAASRAHKAIKAARQLIEGGYIDIK